MIKTVFKILAIIILITPKIYSQSVGTPDVNYEVSPTGVFSYSINIEKPFGVNGFSPEISLTYDSSSGTGVAGQGFHISGLSSITRGVKTIYHDGEYKGMTYNNDNAAFYLDGVRLLKSSETPPKYVNAVYYAEGDPFTKIYQMGIGSNIWWSVEKLNGEVWEYGFSLRSCQYLSHPNGNRINSWFITHKRDAFSNEITYYYTPDHNYLYLEKISYGANTATDQKNSHYIKFIYDVLTEPMGISYVGNIDCALYKRLSRIETGSDSFIYRSYNLDYSNALDNCHTKFWRLTQVTESNGNGQSYKPVTFDWNPMSAGIPTYATFSPNFNYNGTIPADKNSIYVSIDLNGDGISDIVRMSPYGDGYNSMYSYLYVSLSEINGNSVKYNSCSPLKIFCINQSINPQRYLNNYIIGDLNGDGYSDLILLYTDKFEHEQDSCLFEVLFGGEDVLLSNFTYVPVSACDSSFYLCSSQSNTKLKDDLYILEDTKDSNFYRLSQISLKELNNKNIKFTDPDIKYINLNSKPKAMFSGDYNGDGIQDLLITHDKGYKIVFNNCGEGELTEYSDTSLKYHNTMKEGDFNGDGRLDYLYYEESEQSFYFAYFKSDGSVEIQEIGKLFKNGTKKENDIEVRVWDMDNDGKSDVLVIDGITKKNSTVNFFKSDGQNLIKLFQDDVLVEKYNDDTDYCLLPGCYSLNGGSQLAVYGKGLFGSSNKKEWQMYISNNWLFNREGKIKLITDAFSSMIEITYSDTFHRDVYSIGDISLKDVTIFNGFMPLVSRVYTHNGEAGGLTDNYRYHNFMLQRTGKGWLGPESIMKIEKELDKTTSVSYLNWDQSKYIPLKKETIVELGDEINVSQTSEHSNIYYFGTNFKVYVDTIINIDFDMKTTQKIFGYDKHNGTITSIKNILADGKSYNQTEFSDFWGGDFYKLPKLVKTYNYYADVNNGSRNEIRISYTTGGKLAEKSEHSGTDMCLTFKYNYDAHGNIISKSKSGKGIFLIKDLTVYDETNRFPVRIYQEPEGVEHQYTYDRWGNILTEEDHSCPNAPLITSYTYDGWGKEKTKLLPTGEKTTTSWYFDDDYSYGVLVKTEGSADIDTKYDACGRTMYTETVGAGNLFVSTEFEYDVYGHPKTTYVKTGNRVVTETSEYDCRGRLICKENSIGNKETWDYSIANQETYTANGRVTTTFFDNLNRKIKIVGNGGTINYSYDYKGKLSSVTGDGVNIKIGYDAGGYRNMLQDPNTGTIYFTNGADGRLMKREDSKSQSTIYQYDVYNRLSKVIVAGEEINYTYGTSGHETMRLKEWSMGDKSIKYTYDVLGRVIKESRQFGNNGDILDYAYEYDCYNRLSKKIYPGNIEINYYYDNNGYKNKVLLNGTHLIYTHDIHTENLDSYGYQNDMVLNDKMNNEGRLVSTILEHGNNCLFGNILTYSPSTYEDNIMSRQIWSKKGEYGYLIDKYEKYRYDDFDRLIEVEDDLNNKVYTTEYAASGNIIYKHDVGDMDYSYNAVISADDPDDNIENKSMMIMYNGFNRPYDFNINDYYIHARMYYGPDLMKWQMTYCDQSDEDEILYDIIYSPGYERISESNDFETYHFYDVDGRAVIYRHDDSDPQILYVCKDQTGTIYWLIDTNGNVVFDADYDEWGLQTIKTDIVKYIRGFGGHEHIKYTPYVDMVGRVYDSRLGRFLSPDEYVQMPENYQSFNRYSYCLNNPVKYNDPDGQWFGIDDLIVGAVGFIAGYVSNGISTGNWGWESVKAGLAGTVASVVGYNTCGLSVGTISPRIWTHCTNVLANTVLNSLITPTPINCGPFSFYASPMVGFGENTLNVAFARSITYHSKKFSIGIGDSFGTTYWGWQGQIGSGDVSVGFGHTYFNDHANDGIHFGESAIESQKLWHASLAVNDLSIDYYNDAGFKELIDSNGPDVKENKTNTDRWRTTAAEITIGDFTLGSYVDTNNGGKEGMGTTSAIAPNGVGHGNKWNNGKVYSAPIWIGLKNGNQIMRFGYQAPVIQNLTQNLVHKLINNNYYLNYDIHHNKLSYFGAYNPYTPWTY